MNLDEQFAAARQRIAEAIAASAAWANYQTAHECRTARRSLGQLFRWAA